MGRELCLISALIYSAFCPGEADVWRTRQLCSPADDKLLRTKNAAGVMHALQVLDKSRQLSNHMRCAV